MTEIKEGRGHRPPLADRMRPVTLDDIVCQEHLTGAGSFLREAIRNAFIPSMILWGPPGSGKTTLAGIIARSVNRPFHQLSAIQSGVKDIREVIENASQEPVVLFIDEIHRFNKSQQDALLGAVERGILSLIGATTENPSFEVNRALLSRCQVFQVKPLNVAGLKTLIRHALSRDPWLKQKKVEMLQDEALIRLSGGDGRKLLNLLELAVSALGDDNATITDQLVMQVAQQRTTMYDKSGDNHYDVISAFIKSIRGSDPNAAVYWLARMVRGGEDPEFIARRLLILASEDIGNANPNALLLANATFDAVRKTGYPECSIVLSHCTIYLATSPKSNSCYTAINQALEVVDQQGDLAVPLSIRNAPTSLMKELGYKKDYQYAHDFPNNFVDQEFLPDPLRGQAFYQPGLNAREDEIRKFLASRWQEKYGYNKKQDHK